MEDDCFAARVIDGQASPWWADEARASWPDPLHPAFVMLILYGLRRGEALGLRRSPLPLRRAVHEAAGATAGTVRL